MKRRDFLKSTIAASVGAATMPALMLHSQMATAATGQMTFGDYKALVCVYLAGGNDSMNCLIPTDASEYADYAATRQALAIAQNDVLPISPLSSNEYAVGFHPSMSGMRDLFNAGKLGVVANVGTLRQPVTRADKGDISLFPPQLFSHNDQTAHVMRGDLDLQNTTGWMGRAVDLLMSQSTQSPAFSLSGVTLMQTGVNTLPFSLSSSGVVDFTHLTGDGAVKDIRRHALDQILNGVQFDPLEMAYRDKFQSARANIGSVKAALDAASSNVVIPGGNGLAAQLAKVADLISQRNTFGHSRQVYFCGLGGFDTHDRQNQNQPALLQQVSDAMVYFDQRMAELGMQDSVTTFTNSEFGRTASSNGDGTDHGWGGHQFVMGAAVRGGDIYGRLTDNALGSTDHYDDKRGQSIPTLSSDQMSATLLKWFGMGSEVHDIFPLLSNFDTADLGFMRV